MRDIVLIAHNLRSTHNIGSLLRTAEGLGVRTVYLTGYTSYPLESNDGRLPHLSRKLDQQISKTALGAEKLQAWQHNDDINQVIAKLKDHNYLITALEQTATSQPLPNFQPTAKVALIVGREVDGLEIEILALCDLCLEIPMLGQKESFNVVQAAAMALYHIRFTP